MCVCRGSMGKEAATGNRRRGQAQTAAQINSAEEGQTKKIVCVYLLL